MSDHGERSTAAAPAAHTFPHPAYARHILRPFFEDAQRLLFGPMLACLEVACRHRGLLQRMLPAPLRPLEAPAARRVVSVLEAVGVLPEATAPAPA